MMTQADIHVEQTKATIDALKREGKVDRETFDWFKGPFLKHREEQARKFRNEGRQPDGTY